MAGIAETASASLDINTIVSQLMLVEIRRKVLLQQKEAGYQLKLSSVGNLSSAMSSFKSALDSLKSSSNFQSLKAESSDSTIISATLVKFQFYLFKRNLCQWYKGVMK